MRILLTITKHIVLSLLLGFLSVPIFTIIALKLVEFSCNENPECLDGPWVIGLGFLGGLVGCAIFMGYWIVWGIVKIRQNSCEAYSNKQIILQPEERAIKR